MLDFLYTALGVVWILAGMVVGIGIIAFVVCQIIALFTDL